MANKYSAFGTQLQLGDGATPTEAFNTVAGVLDISGPAFSTETIDLTAHDSANAFEEIVLGIKRSGEVTFDIVYDPADATHDDATGLFETYQDRETHNFKIIMTDTANTEIAFSGFTIGWEWSFPVNGGLLVSVTIKPDGEPTIT